jgi:hypothetical protein
MLCVRGVFDFGQDVRTTEKKKSDLEQMSGRCEDAIRHVANSIVQGIEETVLTIPASKKRVLTSLS